MCEEIEINMVDEEDSEQMGFGISPENQDRGNKMGSSNHCVYFRFLCRVVVRKNPTLQRGSGGRGEMKEERSSGFSLYLNHKYKKMP